MPGNAKDFYSSREAAKLLGVAVSTVQLWTNSGILNAWTTGGGHRRISRGSVNKLLEQQSVLHSRGDENPLKVVIVEDNSQQLSLYKKHIKTFASQAEITTATNGYEGLIKIGRIVPDVIITDLMMPNLDGFQMLREIKKLEELSSTSIIVITGLSHTEIAGKGGLPEGVDVLIKPIILEDLKQKILKINNIKTNR